MNIKLRRKEHAEFPEILKLCYEKVLERKQTCYVMLDMLTECNKDTRFVFGPMPNAGYVILAQVNYTWLGLHGKDSTVIAYMAWPMLCPETPRGPGDAGGRYTDYGREVCNAVPCEVW
jgi:hypothetical protein